MKTQAKVVVTLGVLAVLGLAFQLIAPASLQAAGQACRQFASKSCISNISYWYDSCGNIQAVNQNCNNTNQMCSNGMCVNKTGSTGGSTNYSLPPTNYTSGYIQNYRTGCFNNNVQWYDSQGAVQGTYQSCQDANSCTMDTCMDNACKSQLKCDGTTCAMGSADFTTFCANNVQGQITQSTQNSVTQVGGTLAISLFGKKEADKALWVKSVNAGNSDKLEFLMVIKNTSGMALNTLVSTDLTNSIAYTGNLNIDGTASAGNIVSGIDLGSLLAGASKAVYFTGTVQSQNAQAVQVIAKADASGMVDTDFFTVNTATNAGTAAVSDSPFIEFVKKWYLWIIIIGVLIALFVIIFRRLSTNP